jgi:hypothetical protein
MGTASRALHNSLRRKALTGFLLFLFSFFQKKRGFFSAEKKSRKKFSPR